MPLHATTKSSDSQWSPWIVNVHGHFAFKTRMENLKLRREGRVWLRRSRRPGLGSRRNLQSQRLKAELLVYVADLQPVGLVEAGL